MIEHEDVDGIDVAIEKVVWVETKDGKEYRYTKEPGTSGWRRFNEGDGNPIKNLEGSVMYRMLRQKRLNPQARTGMLSDDFDIGLDREQSCPTLGEFDEYAAKHPKGGMPYAMPNLGREEYTTLVHWLAQGASMPEDKEPSKVTAKQIKQWEDFLNGESNKASNNKRRLVARYLYEHLFQAHLHFDGTDNREFYRLVRSTTSPGSLKGLWLRFRTGRAEFDDGIDVSNVRFIVNYSLPIL